MMKMKAQQNLGYRELGEIYVKIGKQLFYPITQMLLPVGYFNGSFMQTLFEYDEIPTEMYIYKTVDN